jgi:hypothetical protein
MRKSIMADTATTSKAGSLKLLVSGTTVCLTDYDVHQEPTNKLAVWYFRLQCR